MTFIDVISVGLTLALFIALIALLIRYFSPRTLSRMAFLCDKYDAHDGVRIPFGKVAAYIAALFLLSRALIALVAVLVAAKTGDWSRLNLSSWIRWDANHYLGLAENWYVNEGDPRFHIVFFPLYPAIVRIGVKLFNCNSGVFATALSNMCLIASGFALYRLAEDEYGAARAKLSLTLFMFSPVTFFYSLPFSESLFFLLTVTCALAAKRKKFCLAVILGALSAATRLLGLLSAIVVFYALIRGKEGLKPLEYVRYALFTCIIALGFAAYLYLNYAVTGSPLTFLTYQREHWSQSMGSIKNTLEYTIKNALEYSDTNLKLGTWIPQSVAIVLSIAALCLSVRLISPSDGAYAILYIWFALSPTWLLSGVRYVWAMYPIYFMISGLLPEKKRGAAAVVISIVTLCFMTHQYMAGSVM